MAPASRLLIGWLTAEADPTRSRRDRFWIATLAAIVVSVILAVRRGRWVTEVVSARFDAAVVAVFRRHLARRPG